MEELADGSVQLIITTPDEEAFAVGIYKECLRVLREDGAFILNIGHPFITNSFIKSNEATSDLERLAWRAEYPWGLMRRVRDVGFRLVSDVVSFRTAGSPVGFDPIEHRATYDNVHEHFFIFAKSKLPKWRHEDVATDKVNIHANVFAVGMQKSQAHAFSPQVVSQFVGDYTDEGDLVLDPQAGSAMLSCVAFAMGRNVILYELEAERVQNIEDSMRNVERELKAGRRVVLATEYGEYQL